MFKNIFLCLASALLLFACEKTTYLNGKVVNKVTGEPVSGATILIRVWYNPGSFEPNSYGIETLTSNSSGDFSYNDTYDFNIYEIRANSFLSKQNAIDSQPVEKGKVNNQTINLVPTDGRLKLQIHNTANHIDTVFAVIISPIFHDEYYVSEGIIVNQSYIINSNTTKDFIQAMASGETVKIYWGFNKRPNSIISEVISAPFMDSIFIPRGDTATFSISF